MENRTEISSLGEFGLIEHLTRNIELQNASSIVGVGDDAAVIDHFGKQTVITNDLLIEGVHFDLMYTPLKHLGYKSVVVNVSDIYAMNAVPTQIVLSLAFSNRFSVESLDEFYEGVYLSLIHISEPTRQAEISYAVFCLKKKNTCQKKHVFIDN